jgi:4-hydroxy-tetrahydrodipicolinate reductase
VGGVAVIGAVGRMGERVRAFVDADPVLQLAAAIEASGHASVGEPIDGVRVSDDPEKSLVGCAVAIDFTVPGATLAVLPHAAAAGVAYVCGTTGFSAEQREEIAQHARRIPIVLAPNFSLSVNVLAWLVREAARKLGPDFDAELLEIHHKLKRDAPSGTALHLAEAVAAGRKQNLRDHVVLERAGDTGARPEDAIGIQTLRGGDNPGEHTVLFVGEGERIELTHRSATRDHFAKGAVHAAHWLIGKPAGLYPIEQVFGLD